MSDHQDESTPPALPPQKAPTPSIWSRRYFIRTSVLGAAALSLSACGDSTPSPGSSTTTTSAAGTTTTTASSVTTASAGTTATTAAASGTATTAAAAGGTPRMGGSLTTAIPNDPPNFDVHLGINISRYYFQSLVYSGLVRPKMGPGTNPTVAEVMPDLAESWEISSDAKTYTFKLRKGVKWHDGTDFTSADVKYSIERILETKPGRDRRFLFEPVASIEAPDPLTVIFKLKFAYSPFLVYLGSIDALIAPKHIPEEQLKDKVVGTGPFLFDSATKGNKYVFKKNPNYFIPGRPYVDNVTLLVQADPSTQLAGLRSSQIDVQFNFSKATLGNLEQVKTLQLQRFLALSSNQIQFNTARKPFDDVRVRRAMTMALDRNALVEVVWGGEGQWDGPVPTAMKDWAVENPPADLPWLKQDVAAAKKLLTEAGFPNGFSTTMNFGTPYQEQVKMAQVAAAQWKEIGVNVELKGVDGPSWNRLQAEKNFDLMCVTFITYEDVDFYTYGFYYPGAGRNIGGWDNKEITELLDKQRQTTSKEERRKVLLDVQKKIADQAWVAYGTTGFTYGVVQNYVKNFQTNPIIYTRQFDQVWLEK